MKEEKTAAAKNSSGKENEPVVENGKKKSKEERPATKVVVRRLPPSMTEEQFKMQVSPLPDIDYFYYVPADMSLMPNAFCRAYINFVDQSDLFIFTQKFDGYVFLDSKGGEFPAVVEFAPFQRIPKNRPNRKKDPKTGTINTDPVFILFKERLEAQNLENKTTANASKQHFFETSLVPEKKEASTTPLLDFIKNRRAERQRIRDEKREEKRKKDLERRRAKEEQRRTKKDDDTSVVKSSQPLPVHPESKPSEESSGASEGKLCSKVNKMEDSNNVRKDKLIDPKVTKEHGVSKKVLELVNFLNKSVIESGNKDTGKNNDKNISVKTCFNLKDIETEIMKNTKSIEQPKNVRSKNCDKFAAPVSIPHYNKAMKMNLCYKNFSAFMPRDRLFVPHSYGRNIVMKPVKMGPPVICSISKESSSSNIEEKQKSSPKSNFPADVFRKNLQKVVADVLGNSKVKSPKENIISKPKTFVKRVLVGAGENSAGKGFNSPGFYLPPRAFGCGQSETMNMAPKLDSPHSKKSHSAHSPKPFKTNSYVRGHLPTFSSKSLPPCPPFSKRSSIFSSKSDGDIEKNESSIRIGGSDESLKNKIEPLSNEVKPQFVRRPYVMPKKSIILDKNCKVIL